MKIIVCGAGNVGKSLVSYLVQGNNDIVVIDNDNQKLKALSKEFDIQPVLGSASHPEVLEKADADKADMLIAATDNDEVNMIACEVGAALFNISKKIARIDSQDFLKPLWGGLFNEQHIAIDLVISPAMEIAKAVKSLLKIPGMSNVTTVLQNKAYILAFRCEHDNLCRNMSINRFESETPDTIMKTLCVIHQGKSFVPEGEYTIQTGDIIYFITPTKNADTIIHHLGMEKSSITQTLIFGGQEIAQYLAMDLEKDDAILRSAIIEEDTITAKKLAKNLQNTAIINGDLMSDVILEEAGIDRCDVAIALTPHDKDNLLISLLAKQHKVPQSISLVNAPSFGDFMENLSNSTLIDGSAVIISSMLQELRKARIRDAYSLGRNFGEIWEVIISDDNPNAGQKIKDFGLPSGCRIGLIEHKGEFILPTDETTLEIGDILVVYIVSKAIKKAEKLFI